MIDLNYFLGKVVIGLRYLASRAHTEAGRREYVRGCVNAYFLSDAIGRDLIYAKEFFVQEAKMYRAYLDDASKAYLGLNNYDKKSLFEVSADIVENARKLLAIAKISRGIMDRLRYGGVKKAVTDYLRKFDAWDNIDKLRELSLVLVYVRRANAYRQMVDDEYLEMLRNKTIEAFRNAGINKSIDLFRLTLEGTNIYDEDLERPYAWLVWW